ncbi:MAG: radical SAM protein [Nanoarchaeota archaeon]|nr:radical SAM protein [Nanoarchaeota archaeon]
MDKEIKETPEIAGELRELVDNANKTYLKNFNSKVWFGRCIFLSWYCERGTCDFCFRSVTKHKIKHPDNAKRSIEGILAEALIIKACGWRIEFLTGGYGIYDFNDILKISKLCSKILEEKIWLNLGTLDGNQLDQLKPYVQGIVSSMETLEPKLHNKVCPDKPIQPYLETMDLAGKKGFKQSITLVIGIGEKKEDYKYTKELIQKHNLERITIYALRPVAGTPYKKGPKSEDVAWWIAKIRCDFPKIEIIAGSAIYRIPEISLFLKAGANAFTKLPATNIFNTDKGIQVEQEVKKSKREFISRFTSKNLRKEFNFQERIDKLTLTKAEKEKVIEKLDIYLNKFEKNLKK